MAILDPDDETPRGRPGTPRDLSRLSLDELHAYVAALRAEIARAEAAITAKRSVRDAAEALFRKRGRDEG